MVLVGACACHSLALGIKPFWEKVGLGHTFPWHLLDTQPYLTRSAARIQREDTFQPTRKRQRSSSPADRASAWVTLAAVQPAATAEAELPLHQMTAAEAVAAAAEGSALVAAGGLTLVRANISSGAGAVMEEEAGAGAEV